MCHIVAPPKVPLELTMASEEQHGSRVVLIYMLSSLSLCDITYVMLINDDATCIKWGASQVFSLPQPKY